MYKLDHFIWACSDINDGIVQLADITGVTPVKGGKHPGVGTQNALLALGTGLYLEIIAPDYDQNLEENSGAALSQVRRGGMLSFCIAAANLTDLAARVKAASLTTTGAADFARETPEGAVMRWQLLFMAGQHDALQVPFFIDWMACAHPSLSAPQAGTIQSFQFCHPDAAALNALYSDLGLDVAAQHADRAHLTLNLKTPKGDVHLPAAVF